MEPFDQEDLMRIKAIFEEKTGVQLAAKRPARRPLRTAAILAAAVVCSLSVTAFAAGLFSPLDGDQLHLAAEYRGAGVVSIAVENQSDRLLRFQPQLKLMRWPTGEEISPSGGGAAFDNTEFPPHTGGTMTVDLSDAYDVAQLETPLGGGDWYYLVLTNDRFVFGQDWMCSVDFAPAADPAPEPAAPSADPAALAGIEAALRPYFETVSYDIEDRRAMDEAYIRDYRALLAGLDGTVVPSLPPALLIADPAPGVLFDDTVPAGEQAQLIGEHALTHDADFKLLAADGEEALVLSAAMPLSTYPDTWRYLPLFCVFTYEKATLAAEDAYVFLHGQFLRPSELAPYQVYEDERYVCYEVSGLLYSDLDAYMERFAEQNPDMRLDDQVRGRVRAIYDYYREHMGDSIVFR